MKNSRLFGVDLTSNTSLRSILPTTWFALMMSCSNMFMKGFTLSLSGRGSDYYGLLS